MISNAYFIEGISVVARETSTCIPRIRLGSSVWQNPVNRYDVNGDGKISLDDYYTLQSWLDTHGEGELPPIKGDTAPYVDVDGDGQATNNDLILLSRFITKGQHEDFAAEDCYPVSAWTIVRDLIAPKAGMTARDVGVMVNAQPSSDFRFFKRDFRASTLTEVIPTTLALVKDSVVCIHNSLFVPVSPYGGGCKLESGILRRLEAYFASTPEILPARFLWP